MPVAWPVSASPASPRRYCDPRDAPSASSTVKNGMTQKIGER